MEGKNGLSSSHNLHTNVRKGLRNRQGKYDLNVLIQ